MERLHPLDAVFVDAEDEDHHASMAIASIAIFEGPAPSYQDFVEAIAGRLPLVPRYRQKLRTVPLRLGPPVWVEDPHFDLHYHIRQTALPVPGGDEELSHLMGRVMAQRLDRDHPLWEYWLVEGLAHDHWALISKVHHCMVDGVSGTDLYRVVFDLTPEPAPPVKEARTVGPEPSSLELAAGAALDMALIPLRATRALGGALRHPGRLAAQVPTTVGGAAKLTTSLVPASGSSLRGHIGRQRRYRWVRSSLEEIKEVKNVFEVTVNDVALAAITGGFRDLLLARHEQPGAHQLRSLVPVSVRAPGEESIYENRVSALFADLPVHLADPLERLSEVHLQLSALKASREADAGEALVALGRYLPFPLASAGVRLVFGVPQREVVTVTTNVPGPRQPLYGLGRRLVEMTPYVPIATTLRFGVSIISYCDQMTFGITGDYDTTPDIDVLARGISHGVFELVKAARATPKDRAQPTQLTG